jgi:hypothetical protein
MKIYKGKRINSCGPADVWVIDPGGKKPNYLLPHIERHSPDGFNWGYGGSGPADLALSILTNFAGKNIADKFYQKFKFAFIAPAGSELIIPGSAIADWLEKNGVVFAANYFSK